MFPFAPFPALDASRAVGGQRLGRTSCTSAVWLAAAAVLSGCALNNPPPVDMGSTAPVTAVAIAPPTQVVSNSGSLYQASRYRPVFENRRARMVGDTVMVQIVEKVAASQRQSSNVSRSNKLSGSVSRLPFLAGSTNGRIT